MADNNGILTYGEINNGGLASVTIELLGAGRRLADTKNEPLSVVLIGKDAINCSQEAVAYGADKVYVIDDAPAENYEGASYTAVMEIFLRETVNPTIVLFGQTMIGRDLAPRLAFRLKTGLVTDCINVEIDSETKNLLAIKPVAGGNVLATYTMKESMPQMATVRCKSAEPLERDKSRQGEIVTIPSGISDSSIKARLIERVVADGDGPNIETAEIIVAGGRGVGSVEDFESFLTQGLARVLGGAVGGTRAAVDMGLLSEQHQVGLTGKIVGPNIYFAVALSGAIQHMTGCSSSKNIVAINKDENAQIFKFSKFGIVGDYKKVLPPLTEKIKELLQSQ